MSNVITLDQLPTYEGGVPTFKEFDPRYIEWQYHALVKIEGLDYHLGPQEILLSGAAGSSKTLLAVHLMVKHCLEFKMAKAAVCRKAFPDLRDTIWETLLSHLACFEEGVDYWVNETKLTITFRNGSKIISKSWADRKSKRGRSLDITMLVIEEATENDDKDAEAINELVARVGRRRGWPRNLVVFLTNPDSPSHWLYKRFFVEKSPFRHVFLSVTKDNPFLPRSYVRQLKATFDPKMLQRMLYGVWLDIMGETIYHAYDTSIHEPDTDYVVDERFPIHFAWDFNIGEGKPLSCVFYQIIGHTFHYFEEIVIEGARTESNLEEAEERGLFEYDTTYYCHGDATATHKDTRNKLSDYGIIDKFMLNLKTSKGRSVRYIRQVPASNPPIRKRHNIVNSYLKNGLGQVRIQVYRKCKTLREGFKLTKLKKGAEYAEDDTKFYQHITTAAGYGICWHELTTNRKKSEMKQL